MAQLKTKFIENNAVNDLKIRLRNNQNLRARNAADSADVNILKVNASDAIEFASLPVVSGANLATQAYVQTYIEGLNPKQAVRAATAVAGTLASSFENGDIIDGVTLATGDRILIKNQADATENGIYVVQATGAPVRANDMNASSEVKGAYTFVQEGSSNQGKGYVQSGAFTTLGTDVINFVFFNSSSGLTGGDGITISGNDVSVDQDGQGLQFVSGQLALELDGATLSKSASGLKVATNGITANELASDSVTTVKILNANVTEAKLASDSVSTAKIVDLNVTTAKLADAAVTSTKLAAAVAGDGIAGGAGTALSVDHDGEGLTFVATQLALELDGSTLAKGAAGLKVATNGITATELASNSVTTGKITDANVTAVKLAADVAGSGLDSTSGVLSVSTHRESVTLSAGDITNQYIDLAQKLIPETIVLVVDGGPVQRYSVDYDANNTGAVTRIRFDSTNLPSSDLATGGAAALVAGDIIRVQGLKV